MSEILHIDFNLENAKHNFVESLSKTGFAVLTNHTIDKALISDVYSDWRKFFMSDEKNRYLYDYDKQDGYFPFKSENAAGYRTKDLKEFFHIYRWGRYPSSISDSTKKLHSDLLELGGNLLDWLDELAPKNIRSNFSMKLSDMINDSGQNLLRVIHYPPVKNEQASDGSIRAESHTDINLITILIAEPGLQVLDQSGRWIDVDLPKNSIVINIGDMLQEASKGFYKSTFHRVVNPVNSANFSRFSMPLFIHPRDEVLLSKNLTAKKYLEQRLKAIGLK
ncbi:MAG: isopenicillin N synthase family oxygenase [Pelagibacteraceae bacterium TMED124]|nr:2OG-Fe(II) oxygenase [Candidatus Neomarinimicrobiota bacterium]RPG18589.1 MAG: isopenicillin N synthase family oxygenase [Pelagibacteraceae bacterium TMED124]|tara:strand:- start:1693 stop:2526 length:834 start_codon:yes stop_codon:yes gene_type:complete